jgi:TPP-dependent pyruvate/acetoin dehydrogenase alpha subunit
MPSVSGQDAQTIGEARTWAPQTVEDPRKADLELYRALKRIRSFEELTRSLFQRGEVFGSVHLCIGQEAVSVGVCTAIEPPDLVAATYRGHGHALALGVDPAGLLAEMMGKATGTCGGRAGSMNVIDLRHQLIGCFGIVGGSIAAATGAALALRRKGGVAVAFFGDGAMNQGYSYECLNLAKVQSLPVVYVCENNQYGEFTPYQAVTAGSILGRPASLDIPARQVDGNDVWAVRSAAMEAVEAARKGDGPQFIEAMTYRFSDHGRGDPVRYRAPGEMEAWKARDPLLIARQWITRSHPGNETELFEIDAAVAAEIEEVRIAAAAAPLPDPVARIGEFSVPLDEGLR